jgi:3-hydroxybutyryl-CoA dehydratase
MAKRPVPAAGDVIESERAFSVDEVREFTRVSGDAGVHHVEADGEGRIMVQGLLTLSMPTRIGGELDFIAAEMNYQFLRPVFAGQTIRCRLRFLTVEKQPGRHRLEVETVCLNPDGKEVMRGLTRGFIVDK